MWERIYVYNIVYLSWPNTLGGCGIMVPVHYPFFVVVVAVVVEWNSMCEIREKEK